MTKSPCRGCIYEFLSKENCIKHCSHISRVQDLTRDDDENRTRSDYFFTDSIHFTPTVGGVR
jgi:hypothetical protein